MAGDETTILNALRGRKDEVARRLTTDDVPFAMPPKLSTQHAALFRPENIGKVLEMKIFVRGL
jgi:hypothetical protein